MSKQIKGLELVLYVYFCLYLTCKTIDIKKVDKQLNVVYGNGDRGTAV